MHVQRSACVPRRGLQERCHRAVDRMRIELLYHRGAVILH